MKGLKWLIGVVLILALAGCSGVVAKSKMSAVMEKNAALARSIKAEEIPSEEVEEKLEWVREVYDQYDSQTSTNFFEYLFSAEKGILMNAKFYKAFRRQKIFLNEVLSRKLSEGEKRWVLDLFSRLIVKWNLAREGRSE